MSAVAVALALFGGIASAQEVDIGPRLREGDEFRLEVTRTRENSSRPQHNGKSTTTIVVRVISATPEATTLDWTPGDTAFANPNVAADPLLLAASRAMGGIALRLTLNADGEFSGVANHDEVVSRLQAGVDVIARELKAKLPDEQRAGFEKLLAQVLSPAMLIGSATREAQMYFGLNGVALAVGKAVETNVEQPSPFGGGVIPATFRVEAESATGASAVIKTATTYDGAALLRLTRALVEQSGKAISEDELAKLPRFEMGDDGTYTLDREVGLMREVVVNRSFSAGTNRRRDGWEIRRIDGPKR